MTERKPAGMPFESWVDRQISQAMKEGKFDDLPGLGKPIPDLLKPETELDYVAKIARREGLEGSLFLPPALALAKEREDLPERLAREWDEARVRALVEDLNARIRRERVKPQEGPPFRVRDVDVEQAVAQWRAARPAPVQPGPEPEPEPEPRPTGRRSWWRRRA
jgi:hypothetical protein